ncbi:LSU ribosomal protein L29P [Flavobacteriaceae bacterium MAR_2010_188]|nr:LSU ribosomal protein L29P [Flavobacteriaceae bacterium MAR_2010_188]
MKQSDISQLSTAELKEKLMETKKSYSDLKMAHTISPLENPIQLRNVRRSVARIATELTKRELQQL